MVLIGKNSPKIENDFVVFDAGNDRWLRRAEAVGQLLSPVDAETVAGQGLLRCGSAAEGGTGGTTANRHAGGAQAAAQARRPPLEAVDGGLEHRVERDLFEMAAVVRPEHLVHHDQRCFVRPQGPIEGVFRQRFHPFAAPDDEAALWTAEELVPGETHDVRTGIEDLADSFLVRQAPAAQIVQRSRALIDKQWQTMGVGELRELTDRRLRRETDDAEVGLVGDQKSGGLFGNCGGKIPEVGAVGTADLRQVRTGGGHHVGQPEGPADLDQLAARHDDFAPRRVGLQEQEKGGGIVVDHDGTRCAADLRDAAGQRRQALSASPFGDVELEGEV